MLNVLIVLMQCSCAGFHVLWVAFQDPRGINSNVQAKLTRKLAEQIGDQSYQGTRWSCLD